MAPGSRCMSGNTCGRRMSWTYRWAVMVPRISTRIQFPRARHHSKWRRRWWASRHRNGRCDPKCPSARCLRMAREDTGVPNGMLSLPGWRPGPADEAVGCTRAFLTMWWSSQRLVFLGHPEPGLHVNDIYRIHWSRHLLTTQSERPN
ncbi:uncharacterized protein TNCV_2600951 [Trichonephila clavipes]|nr:uncharacterized protein TNCV_2600951 [Trichonephila clavipes]